MELKRASIIHDFDGVVADSEVVANAERADIVRAVGVPATLEDTYRLDMGERLADVIAAFEVSVGKPLPADFAASDRARTLDRFRWAPLPVRSSFANAGRSIASSQPGWTTSSHGDRVLDAIDPSRFSAASMQ